MNSVFQIELKFPAPGKPGNYQYTVYLRSDSYMGLDQVKPLKVTFSAFVGFLFAYFVLLCVLKIPHTC